MGRRGGGGMRRPSASRSAPRSAPARSAPARSAPASKPAQKPAQSNSGSAQPAAPAAAPSGGGFLGNVAAMAAGSFIGHKLADTFGGGSEGGQNIDGAQMEQIRQQCEFYTQNFNDCLQKNAENIGACQYPFTSLQQCISGEM